MQPFEKVERSKKQIIVNNFLGGIAWGLGVTVGLAVLLSIIGYALSKVEFGPMIQELIQNSVRESFYNTSR
jgi:hypothetical protein